MARLLVSVRGPNEALAAAEADHTLPTSSFRVRRSGRFGEFSLTIVADLISTVP